MRRPRRYEGVELVTTPKELRELADKLEAEWRRTKLGEEVPSVKLIGHQMDTEVVIRIDQEEMHRQGVPFGAKR